MKPWFVVIGIAVATIGAAGTACHDNSQSCTTAGCSSGVLMQLSLSPGSSPLSGTTVNVCRNSECHSAVLPAMPEAGGAGAPIVFADTNAVLGTLWLEASQTIGIDLEWHVDDASLLVDGDRYVVSLGSDPGTAAVMLDQTATYQILRPNGDQCPPVCTYAVLTP
jgi:hypothetical protein